jgi:hypothetical protein
MPKPDHYHCSRYDCEHPQPFWFFGEFFCGLCWAFRGKVSRCILCNPEICDDG